MTKPEPDPIVMEARYRELIAEMEREHPGFRVVRKDLSRFQRVLDKALKAVTFGSQRFYLTSYQTTIGKTVYVTADWDALPAAQRYITMRHERVHVRQFERYGVVLMGILYLLLPLPAGVAWFRAHFEKQGYAESIRAAAEVHGVAYVERASYRDYIVGQFTGGAYGWMWPFRRGLERWYDGVVRSLKESGGGR